jgi:hypothetical protein
MCGLEFGAATVLGGQKQRCGRRFGNSAGLSRCALPDRHAAELAGSSIRLVQRAELAVSQT